MGAEFLTCQYASLALSCLLAETAVFLLPRILSVKTYTLFKNIL